MVPWPADRSPMVFYYIACQPVTDATWLQRRISFWVFASLTCLWGFFCLFVFWVGTQDPFKSAGVTVSGWWGPGPRGGVLGEPAHTVGWLQSPDVPCPHWTCYILESMRFQVVSLFICHILSLFLTLICSPSSVRLRDQPDKLMWGNSIFLIKLPAASWQRVAYFRPSSLD